MQQNSARTHSCAEGALDRASERRREAIKTLSAAAKNTANDCANQPDSAYDYGQPDNSKAEEIVKTPCLNACLCASDETGIAAQGGTLFGFGIVFCGGLGDSFRPSFRLLGWHGAGHVNDERARRLLAFPWPRAPIWTAQRSGFGLFEYPRQASLVINGLLCRGRRCCRAQSDCSEQDRLNLPQSHRHLLEGHSSPGRSTGDFVLSF